MKFLNKRLWINTLLLICILINIFPIYSQTKISGWKKVNPIANDNGDILNLFFFSKDSGYVTGVTRFGQGNRHVVAFTKDGGVSWDTTIIPTSSRGTVISFFNRDIGITGDARIYKTSNAGTTWQRSDSAFGFFFASLKTIELNFAYCSGTEGKIIKTTDQGLTWNHIETEIFKNTRYGGLSVIDSISVFTNCDDQLLKTTDGGNSWMEINIPNDIPRLWDVKFIDINYGWIVGGTRSIFQTTNGGETWEDQSPANSWDSFVSIDACDKNTAVTVSSAGAVFWTTDGGEDWEEQVSQYSYGDLFKVQMLNELDAWAVGRDGLILKTTSGGITWIDNENNVDLPENYSLSQNYPNPFSKSSGGNSATVIKFSIPNAGNVVSLKVYDVLGNEVATLVNKKLSAGEYEVKFDGSGLPSGVYYYRLQAGNFAETKKMIILK
ncbi:MAG: T9SS type A sorting domain-containing protein [Chlorobi bacterium]|nr:T9SS type A sorting domain-containing protein [Chlorobiota bacterium]